MARRRRSAGAPTRRRWCTGTRQARGMDACSLYL
jgi:hypothetical protein